MAKARERGIEISETAPDSEVWQLIMAPGFSTAEQVTDVSGRGVGMDVVRRNIEAMGGKIDITSSTGQGSGIHIRLPLTLAILDGMSVSVSDQQFIVPLVNIVESVQPSSEQLMLISNQQMLFLRDLYWPIVKLGELMQLPDAIKDPLTGILVLVESSRNRFAMLVDDLLGQQQVVIKSLEQHYRRVDGVAGATIMGDGSVALILDVESLADIPATSIN
jgi:two-component system chemotaxis sensor kinase CheA